MHIRHFWLLGFYNPWRFFRVVGSCWGSFGVISFESQLFIVVSRHLLSDWRLGFLVWGNWKRYCTKLLDRGRVARVATAFRLHSIMFAWREDGGGGTKVIEDKWLWDRKWSKVWRLVVIMKAWPSPRGIAIMLACAWHCTYLPTFICHHTSTGHEHYTCRQRVYLPACLDVFKLCQCDVYK